MGATLLEPIGSRFVKLKNTRRQGGLVKKASGQGQHRRRRERAPLVEMILHQDASTHQWVAGR